MENLTGKIQKNEKNGYWGYIISENGHFRVYCNYGTLESSYVFERLENAERYLISYLNSK